MFILALIALVNIASETAAAINSDTHLNQLAQLENRLVNPDPDRDQHEALFKERLNKANSEKSHIIDRAKHDKIVQYLKNQVVKPEANFKFYVKDKQFNLMLVDDQEVLHKKFEDKKEKKCLICLWP